MIPALVEWRSWLMIRSFLGHIFEHLAPHGIDPRKEGIMRFSLTLKESAFVWLCQAIGIHPSFIESLNYMVGHYAAFTDYSEDDQTPEMLREFCLYSPPDYHRRLTLPETSW